jgi:hypothetical protein
MKYKVRSGDLNVIVEASSHNIAMMKAIDESKRPISLGVIVGALKEGDNFIDEVFAITENILKSIKERNKKTFKNFSLN